MFTHLLGASFEYADIAFLCIIGLFLILGLIRGIAKSFKGFLVSIAIILLSLFLLGLTFAPIRQMDISMKLEDTLITSSQNWGDIYTQEIYFNADGSLAILVDGNLVPLADAASGIKGKFASYLASKFITEDGQTLGGVIVDNITSLIVSLIVFILYCILLGIIVAIFRKMTEKMHFSDNGAVKTIDRIAGGLISAGLSLIFILFVLAIFASLDGKMPTVIEYVKKAPMCNFFYTHNPIATVLTNIFG